MDLTTLAEVKAQGNVPDASDDAWLAAAITSVFSILETEALAGVVSSEKSAVSGWMFAARADANVTT